MANKSDLINAVAASLDTTKVCAAEVVESVLGNIAQITADGSRLVVVGFGTFVNKTTAARTGVNPQTGAKLDIPAKTKLTFKQSKAK